MSDWGWVTLAYVATYTVLIAYTAYLGMRVRTARERLRTLTGERGR